MYDNNRYIYNLMAEIQSKRQGDPKSDKSTTKYQCFCGKQYLSYPALYLHLKNKHSQCFVNNKKTQSTKLKEISSEDGARILKMQIDLSDSYKDKYKSDRNLFLMSQGLGHPAYNQYFPPHSFGNQYPSFMNSPYYTQLMNNQIGRPLGLYPMGQNQMFKNLQHRQGQYSKFNIVQLINKFMKDNIDFLQRNNRQKIQVQILFDYLIYAIKIKSIEIKEKCYKYDMNQIIDMTKHNDCKYLINFLPYFRNKYFERQRYKLLQATDEQKIKLNITQVPFLSQQEKKLTFYLRNGTIFKHKNEVNKLITQFQSWLINKKVINSTWFAVNLYQ